MAIVKMLTDVVGLQVSEDDGDTFTTVSGLMNITWEEDTEEVETTTFDDGGYSSMLPGVTTLRVEVEGYRLQDSTTFVRDVGQKAVEKAARQKEPRTFRLVLREDPENEYREFIAYPFNGSFGGGLNEALPWSVSLAVDGGFTDSGDFFDVLAA